MTFERGQVGKRDHLFFQIRVLSTKMVSSRKFGDFFTNSGRVPTGGKAVVFGKYAKKEVV